MSFLGLFKTTPAPNTRNAFKARHTLETRCKDSEQIRLKHADRIPVIVEKLEKSDIEEIDKQKYLVPMSLTVSEFMSVIRKRVKLAPEKAMFIFINNTIPPSSASLGDIYESHKDEDGFLYITYAGESTFGGY